MVARVSKPVQEQRGASEWQNDNERLLTKLESNDYFVPAYAGHKGWIGVELDKGLGGRRSTSMFSTHTPKLRRVRWPKVSTLSLP